MTVNIMWTITRQPTTDYHELDKSVSLPVYIKAYNRKNGEPSYTLNVQKMDSSRGEHF